MLALQEIRNIRAFLKRGRDISGEETVAHALCLQALDREEKAVADQNKAGAKAQATETQAPETYADRA